MNLLIKKGKKINQYNYQYQLRIKFSDLPKNVTVYKKLHPDETFKKNIAMLIQVTYQKWQK